MLITAGPTYEKIDPVRFIGNYSSGKMGFALAEACAEQGAEVCLVAGPTSLRTYHPSIRRVNVESAQEMLEAAQSNVDDRDVVILCAAVADYTPAVREEQKMKREKKGGFALELKPTTDIAATLGARKRPGQLFIGFALETENGVENAAGKMQRKNQDFVVLNSLTDPGAGFQTDTNKITILAQDGRRVDFGLKSKKEVARDIISYCVNTTIKEL